MTIVGARPQFIKASVLSREIAEHNRSSSTPIEEMMVHTGQHFDQNMSGNFFEQLAIPTPKFNLDINQGHHGQMTGRMLEGLEQLMLQERPDRVLVYGDTNSTLAGALAASKLHIPVAHVEAGLRSFNKQMPEELNRIMADHVSDLLFCPTQAAVNNLARENIKQGVHLVGDIMYDAFLFAQGQAQANAKLPGNIQPLLDEDFVLATLHRAENTDDPARLKNALNALNRLALTTPVIFPLHPRTKNKISEYDLQATTTNLTLCEPLGYNEMVLLLSHCSKVITDSGGLQKEAYFAKVPCITLRDQTEWVETLEAGWNKLVNLNMPLTEQQLELPVQNDWQVLYGNGLTGKRVLEYLRQVPINL